MKSIIFLAFLTLLLSGTGTVKSQGQAVTDKISSINSLLKANPYLDTFLEITFFYSIDITPENELVVNMDFKGPFRTIARARIADLNPALQIDTALQGTSSVCWYCKQSETTGESNCVYNESITTDGEKEVHYTDNICVMITRQSDIREKLINSFHQLFRNVPEQ